MAARGNGVIRTRIGVVAKTVNATIRVMRGRQRAVNAALKSNVALFHARVKRTTQQLSPVRSGFMRDHVETRFSDGGYGAETGWFRDVFMRHRRQTRGRFYPPYQEYLHRPSLTPAYRKHETSFLRGIRQALKLASEKGAR